jgi:hypothetical protein
VTLFEALLQRGIAGTRLTREDWFRLPLKLRRRWWYETYHGAWPPTDALRLEIATALGRKQDLVIDGQGRQTPGVFLDEVVDMRLDAPDAPWWSNLRHDDARFQS